MAVGNADVRAVSKCRTKLEPLVRDLSKMLDLSGSLGLPPTCSIAMPPTVIDRLRTAAPSSGATAQAMLFAD